MRDKAEEFRQRRAAEEARREHNGKIAGQEIAIRRRRPALRFGAEEPCPVEPGEVFEVGPHRAKVGRIQRVFVKPEDGGPRWEWRAELIHEEHQVFIGARPPAGGPTRQRWTWEDEHGYTAGADLLDAGAVPPPEPELTRIEREQRMAEQRQVKRAEQERIGLERRLNEVRKRGMTRTAEVVRLQLRKVVSRLDDAA